MIVADAAPAAATAAHATVLVDEHDARPPPTSSSSTQVAHVAVPMDSKDRRVGASRDDRRRTARPRRRELHQTGRTGRCGSEGQSLPI